MKKPSKPFLALEMKKLRLRKSMIKEMNLK